MDIQGLHFLNVRNSDQISLLIQQGLSKLSELFLKLFV